MHFVDESIDERVSAEIVEVPTRTRQRGAYRVFIKRWFDALSSFLALLVLGPFLLLVAIAVKLDSRGPVLFCQERVGKDGKVFRFYKFRSMVVGADRMKKQLSELNELDGPVFKITNDPRMTKVGKLIRKTSIDELPQLFNVLRGDMSLVGPRPPLPDEVEEYEQWQRRKLDVLPGMTCLWQISGRNMIGFREWMRLDIEYVENCSFGLDIKILLRTIPAVISRKGAY